MGRPKKLEPCMKCGTMLSAWERQRHKCPDKVSHPGRPPVLRACLECGAMLSWTDARSHICVRTPAQMSRPELINRISAWQDEHGRKRAFGTGCVCQAKNGTWYGFVTVGRGPDGNRMRRKLTGHSMEIVEGEVTAALREAGIAPSPSHYRPRLLSNRSMDQLRRMYSETLRQQGGSQ